MNDVHDMNDVNDDFKIHDHGEQDHDLEDDPEQEHELSNKEVAKLIMNCLEAAVLYGKGVNTTPEGQKINFKDIQLIVKNCIKRLQNKGQKKTKSSGSGKNVGFSKTSFFMNSIMKYHYKVIASQFPGKELFLPSFQEYIPGTKTVNPMFGLIKRGDMTTTFSMISSLNQRNPKYFSVTPEFYEAHKVAIQRAIEKDKKKNFTFLSTEDMIKQITDKTKSFKSIGFNPECYNHAHQSKIIETSKREDIEFIQGERPEDCDDPHKVYSVELEEQMKVWPGFTNLDDFMKRQNEELVRIKTVWKELIPAKN